MKKTKSTANNNTQQDEAKRPPDSQRSNNVGAVMEKYKSNGWNAFLAPKNSINDIISHRGDKYHFVQVVTSETQEDANHSGLAKNTFIQNAFSNGAIPVYAHVSVKQRRDSTENITITFEDVNLSARIIINNRNVERKTEAAHPPVSKRTRG